MRYLLFISLFFSWAIRSQELPPVLNFNPNDYAAGNQNWRVSRADNGNVYVANSMGLLEFNGTRWELYPVPNHTIVRAAKAIGDRVFTGAYMEAGYWQKNTCGNLEYQSLLSKFPERIRDGEQFWRIESVGQRVIFQSFEGIYVYSPGNDSISRLETPSGQVISNLFRAGSEIYFMIPGAGLFSVQNAAARLEISAEELNGMEVIYVTNSGQDLRLVSRRGEIYDWNGQELNLQAAASERIIGKSIFSAIQLSDGSLLLGSVEEGLFHISEEGVLLEHFHQENGLQNNTVLSLFLDEEDNVWAGLDNGLSILNLKSPFRLFQDHVGRIGTVYTSFQDEDHLYLGTNQGLYFRGKGEGNFRFIPGTNGQVWSLNQIDGILFCGHNNGTFIITAGTAEKVSERQGTWLITKYEPEEDVYVQGHYNGFSLLERSESGFLDLPLVRDFPHSSKFVISEENGDLWIGNEHKGVFRLKLQDSWDEIEQITNYPLEEESGITSSIFRFNDGLFYATKKEIFQYDPVVDSFVKDNELAAAFKDVERISGKMIAVGNNVVGFGSRAIVSAEPSKFEKGYSVRSVYLPQEYRSIPLGYENVTPLEGEKYLLGLVDGYLLFDDDFKESQQEFTIRIDKVTKAGLDEPSMAVALTETPDFDYHFNNLNFYFSIPEYRKYVVPRYSYRLRGFNSRWSEWTTESTASFKNLPYGNYTFEVKGMVGDEEVSTASFHFGVDRPWYLSNLAVAGYVLLFLLFLFIIHVVYKREHEKRIRENEKALKMKSLEAEQKIIKLQNEQLEKEMAGKSKELAVSTMSLIKKNEFLSSIREKLKESEGSTQVKSVIKTIDKDISEEDNWNFFKRAFSNADKDFFRKMKGRHPGLTSNDLKLCAYLRLNLTSKEIAPLLNISVKSVEIKRYRLRKKMDLPHEMNLVDYIMAV